MRLILIFLMAFTYLFSLDFKPSVYWINLLKNKKYDTLEKELHNLQEQYHKDPKNEIYIIYALSSFKNENLKIEDDIKKWIEAKHESPFPYIALGKYYHALAWKARGNKFANETSKEQFENLARIEEDAKSEYKIALNKDNKSLVAYQGLINSVGSVDSSLLEPIYKEAIKANPNSFYIRRSYLEFNLLRWGGSYKKIAQIVQESRKFYSKNPKLDTLEGFVDYAKADQAYHSLKFEKALEYVQNAIKKGGEYFDYIRLRGNINMYLKNYDQSLKDFTLAHKKRKYDEDILSSLIALYYKKRDYENTLKYAKILSDLGDKATLLKYRGYINYIKENNDEALLDLMEYLTYKPDDVEANKYIGYIYYYSKKDYDAARTYLKSATSDKNDPILWYALMGSQWHLKDCNFVKSAKMYESICQNSVCDSKNLDWAVKSYKYALNRGICKE